MGQLCREIRNVREGWPACFFLDLTRFNKIVIQETPQMAVDKEARAYRESTHIVILSVPCPYTKCKGQSININVHRNPNNVRKRGGGKCLVRILLLTKTLKI